MPTVAPPRCGQLARYALAAVAILLADSVFLPLASARLSRTVEHGARDRKLPKGSRAAVGSIAPDFQLRDLAGKRTVRLSKLRGRPVVLWFGSYTCQPFRGSVRKMESLYAEERSKAEFYVVYTREAHPGDAEQGHIRRTRTTADRRKAAVALQKEMRLTVPILLDTMSDEVCKEYDAPGARVYVIDRAGKIAFRTSVPAEAVEVAEAAQALQRVL